MADALKKACRCPVWPDILIRLIVKAETSRKLLPGKIDVWCAGKIGSQGEDFGIAIILLVKDNGERFLTANIVSERLWALDVDLDYNNLGWRVRPASGLDQVGKSLLTDLSEKPDECLGFGDPQFGRRHDLAGRVEGAGAR